MGRYLLGVGSSYVALGAATLYTLGMVPVALHYLSRAEFGLWALIVQLAGYLALIDLGINTAMSRLLIDHKDQPETGQYGSLLRTGWLVSMVQGAVILASGPFLVPWLADLLAIESTLRSEFMSLLEWQCVLVGATFAIRPFNMLLFTHQRVDVTNYGQIVSWAVNFAVTWATFATGWGVFSLVWGGCAAWLVNQGIAVLAVKSLGLLPRAGQWGRSSWPCFRELMVFGKDLFVIILGNQFMDASQVIVVSRTLGLEAAALWSVGTKSYQLLMQIPMRITGLSASALAEMMVRGDHERAVRRSRAVVSLAVSLSACLGLGLVLGNTAFVTIWTSGKFHWQPHYDLALALCLLAVTLKHAHINLAVCAKELAVFRWVYPLEGLVYFSLGLMLTPHGGFGWLILLTIACMTAFTLNCGLRRTAKQYSLPLRAVVVEWLNPLGRLSLRLVPLALLTHLAQRGQSPLVQLVICAFVVLGPGMFAMLRYGLPRELQEELAARLPEKWGALVSRLTGCSRK